MSFVIKNTSGSAVVLPDLGLTIPTGTPGTPTYFDLSTEQANDVANSIDLQNAITAAAGTLVFLDPRDHATPQATRATLSVADSLLATQFHNDTHWGIIGGRFDTLDDPTTGVTDGDIVRWNAASGEFIACTPASFGPIVGSQGVDGVDTTYVYTATAVLHDAQDETFYDGTNNNGTFVGGPGTGPTNYAVNDVITLSDGSTIQVDAIDANGDVTQFSVLTSGATGVTAGVPLTQTGVIPVGPGPQTGFTLTPQPNNISTGTIQWDVDDVFLRNTGDTLDSGTLTIASGATVDFPTGSNLTIAGDVNQASIITPAGGFQNATDIINKGYVDALVQGIDWKESVRVATEPNGGPGADGDVGGTYATTPSNGQLTGVDLSSVTGDSIDGQFYTGNPATGLADNDRVLLKDQTDPKENGIYFIVEDAAGGTNTGDNVTLRRAPDQDGTPTSEVSGGNTTFVEDLGTVNSKTIWSVIWDGEVTLNTDPVNWSLTGAPTDILANEGLNSVVNEFNLDISTLTKTATTIALNDVLAFDDVDASDPTTDTYKITVQNFLNDRDVVYGITSNGIIRRTGNDTYEQISISAAGAGALDGLNVANGGTGDTGNIVVGLDIASLPSRPAVDTADLVAVYDQAGNNVSYTVGDIAGAISTTNSYTNWTNTGNGTGGPIGPATGTDTIDWNGGDGIDIDMTSGTPDTITVTFTRSGLADTAIDGANDTFPFFDFNNANQVEYRGFNDAFDDLGVPFGLTGTGIVVKDADSPDSYTVRSIAVEGAGAEAGLSIDDGDGVSGNPTLGLDINGQAAVGDDMDTDDEFIVWHQDDTANEKMTGQEVADGTATILGISGLTIVNIDAQPTLVITDTTRTGSPQLSVETTAITWAEAFVSDNDWISIGNAIDALSGFIIPHKARIVKITAHTEDDNNISKAFDLYIDGASQSLFAFTAVNGENEFQQVNTDIQVAKDTKLRVRATNTPSGSIGDTVITLWLKWEV